MRTLISILSAVIFLLACNTSAENKQEKTGAEAQQDQQSKTSVTVNNIAIEYDECGQRDTTLLFIHGWGINKEYWDDQKKYFCNKYKVVTLDLPGFGKSGKNRDNWSFAQYAADINEFIKQKKLKKVIPFSSPIPEAPKNIPICIATNIP